MADIWKIKLRRLEKYRCGFFDTNTGYFQIPQSVGVDSPSEILFLTDGYQEAVVEKAAGLEVMISVRPGNEPLPENHGFKRIESLLKSEIQDDPSNSVA